MHCVVFDTEAEAIPWVRLRHTGANQGAGLVEWGSDEQDRFNARHDEEKRRSTAGQVIDFVNGAGLLSEAAKESRQKIISNVQRLINRPKVRERLGIAFDKGELRTYHSHEQTARALTRLVEDLLLQRIRVRDIYLDEQRDKYASKTFPDEFAPDRATRLDQPVPLAAAPHEGATPRKRAAAAKKPRRRVDTTERKTLIPASCDLNIPDRRIHNLYVELRGIEVDQFPNACSVALRVFLELSADYYNQINGVMTDVQLKSNPPLAKKVKDAATHLHTERHITLQHRDALHTLMDQRQGILAASVPTLHSYVHDRHIFPKPKDLKLAWDELEPFFIALWP